MQLLTFFMGFSTRNKKHFSSLSWKSCLNGSEICLSTKDGCCFISQSERPYSLHAKPTSRHRTPVRLRYACSVSCIHVGPGHSPLGRLDYTRLSNQARGHRSSYRVHYQLHVPTGTLPYRVVDPSQTHNATTTCEAASTSSEGPVNL